MLARKDLHYPVLLRCCGPILLHWQRRQRSPAVRQQVRLPGSCVHQEQDHRINGWQGTPKNRGSEATNLFVVYILTNELKSVYVSIRFPTKKWLRDYVSVNCWCTDLVIKSITRLPFYMLLETHASHFNIDTQRYQPYTVFIVLRLPTKTGNDDIYSY
jgi:hypothetical protein